MHVYLRLVSATVLHPRQVGVPWGEAPGRFWGKGFENVEGFRGLARTRGPWQKTRE